MYFKELDHGRRHTTDDSAVSGEWYSKNHGLHHAFEELPRRIVSMLDKNDIADQKKGLVPIDRL